MGPSNSGKSTLAVAISKSSGYQSIHLDQLRHFPGTNWQQRPVEEFITLHNQAISGKVWVIEGNYSMCLPERLARATGFILLDVSTPLSLVRYLRRTLFESKRVGSLGNKKDHIQWSMIRHIMVATQINRRRYREVFNQIKLPKISLLSSKAINNFYYSETLYK